jgi:hypothetical protein
MEMSDDRLEIPSLRSYLQIFRFSQRAPARHCITMDPPRFDFFVLTDWDMPNNVHFIQSIFNGLEGQRDSAVSLPAYQLLNHFDAELFNASTFFYK